MSRSMNTYHRVDGIVGCGFFGDFGGLMQHSIAWPDQPATRMRDEDLEERQIDVKQVAVVSAGERNAIDWAAKPNGGYTVEKLKEAGYEVEVPEAAPEPLPVAPPASEDAAPFDPSTSEAENIRRAIAMDPDATNRDIIALLNSHGVNVSSPQVTRERKAMKAAE
jgi:hypothetical protein